MSDELPVKRVTAYVVGPEGAVERYAPPPPPARLLSREERIDAYREGLRNTADALREVGFTTHYQAEHTVSMEFRGYLFDFRIQRPSQVAHVTSQPTSTIENRKASIYKLSDEVKSEFALQMIIGKEFSARPIFVALDESNPDPAKYIKDAVMGFLASLDSAGHRLGKSTTGRHPELTYEPKALPEWIERQVQ